MRYVLLFLVVFYLTGIESVDADKIKDFAVGVDISTVGDEALKNIISSYVQRELRSLGDVEVNDDDSKFRIVIIADTVKMDSGNVTGYAFAVAFIKGSYSYHGLFEDMYLMACGNSDRGIRAKCSEIVTLFDTKILENYR